MNAVGVSGSAVRLEPATGLGRPNRSQGGRMVTFTVHGKLAEGVHTVEWQATAQDGDIMTGIHLALHMMRDVADTLDIGDRRAAEFHDEAAHGE